MLIVQYVLFAVWAATLAYAFATHKFTNRTEIVSFLFICVTSIVGWASILRLI